MPKKKKKPFKDLTNAAIGLGAFGLATGVGASIASRAPANVAGGLTTGFSTAAGFAPIIVTAVGANTVLKMVKGRRR